MVNTTEPISLTAGDTISFTKSLADYPATGGWSLKYELRGGAQAIEFTSTASGDYHVLAVTAATTLTWLPAEYVLFGFAIKGGERHEFFKASFEVKPDAATSAADADVTTHAQRMITKLEAVLEGKAGDDIIDSEIEGTVIRRMPFDDIRKMRAKYRRERQAEIAQENARLGRPTGRKILTRLCIT